MNRQAKRLVLLALALILLLALTPLWAAAPAQAAGAAESEENNSIETANAIATNTEISGSISAVADNDWFKFTLPKDGMVSLTFGHPYIDNSNSFWKTTFYTADKISMSSAFWRGDATTDGTSCEIGLPAGTYYLMVSCNYTNSTNYRHSSETYHFKLNYTVSDNWEKELNDAFTSPCTAPVNTQISGSIMSVGDEDWYKFTLPEDGMVSLTFGHPYIDNSNSFWKTTFYTADKTYMSSDYWQGNATTDGTSCEIGLPAGTYYLTVACNYTNSTNYYFSSKTYHFKLNYTVSDNWEKELNDAFTSPCTAPVNTQISGSIMTVGDNDWYQFTLPKDGMVSLTFGHPYIDNSNSFWKTTFYTADKAELASYYWYGNAMKDGILCEIGLPAGTYYLTVACNYTNSTNYYFSSKTYHFTLNYTVSDNWEKELNDSFTSPCTATVNTQISGSIMTVGDNDWYQFTLPKDGMVSLTFGHPYIDNSKNFWKTTLYNSDKTSLASYYWQGSAMEDKTADEIGLSAGTYYLMVSCNYTNSTNYSHSLATYHFILNAKYAEPGEIKSVTVTPSSGGKITLKWSASENAAAYILQRHERGSSVWTTLASNIKGTTYTDTSGEAGKIYQYRVRGRDGNSFGPYKTSAEVACMSGSEPGSVGTPTVKPSSGGKITVSWKAADGAATYILQRNERGSSTWTTLASNLKETKYTDTSAKVGKVYRYRVRSRNVSAFGPFKVSVEVASMKNSAPGAVSNVTVTAAAKKITVSWGAAEGAASYIVQRKERGGDTWTTLNSNVKETSYVDTTGEVGAVYQYRVRSRNVSTYGSFKASTEVGFMSGSTPGDIKTVTVKAASGKITVTWTAASGAAGYIVQRKVKGASTWENLSTNVTELSYVDKTAKAGTVYQYRVRSRNGNIYGNFKASAEVTAK